MTVTSVHLRWKLRLKQMPPMGLQMLLPSPHYILIHNEKKMNSRQISGWFNMGEKPNWFWKRSE